jgi:hypothetical protein
MRRGEADGRLPRETPVIGVPPAPPISREVRVVQQQYIGLLIQGDFDDIAVSEIEFVMQVIHLNSRPRADGA